MIRTLCPGVYFFYHLTVIYLFIINRGAEQTWQGLTVTTDNPTKLLRNIGVTKVSCNGQESVFHNCKLQNGKLDRFYSYTLNI